MAPIALIAPRSLIGVENQLFSIPYSLTLESSYENSIKYSINNKTLKMIYFWAYKYKNIKYLILKIIQEGS